MSFIYPFLPAKQEAPYPSSSVRSPNGMEPLQELARQAGNLDAIQSRSAIYPYIWFNKQEAGKLLTKSITFNDLLLYRFMSTWYALHIVRKRNLVSFLFCALERELECTQVELLQNGSPEQVKAASHALAQFQRSRPSARLVDRETGFGGSRKEELQHKEPSFLSTGQETPVSKAFLTSRLIETKDSTKDHWYY